jgi:adenosylcobinamide-phosphate synthase
VSSLGDVAELVPFLRARVGATEPGDVLAADLVDSGRRARRRRRHRRDRWPGRGGSPLVRRSFVPVVAGLAVDALVGEPPPSVPHPVALFGRSMHVVEAKVYARSRARGGTYAGIGVVLGGTVGRAMRSTAVATYVAVAGRALADAAIGVRNPLMAGDLEIARERLRALVGRDPTDLAEHEIARAVVESVAENTVDAVVAPALWAAVLGARGALTYRAINTMDAMVGYRNDRYEHFGTAAARIDDVANFVPARVTALLVMAACPATAQEVWRVVRRDATVHPSPNAGVVEAAFAAALGCRLGGVNRYGDHIEERAPLGDGPPATAADIDRAVALSRRCTVMLAGTLLAAELVRRTRRR